jgi:osmotically-inducible protein OsmY
MMSESRTRSVDATTDIHTGRQILALGAVCAAVLAMASMPATRAEAATGVKDRKIVSAIETNLLINDEVPSHKIDVSAEDGIVTLSGSVYNILAHDKATEVAESIKGVRSVVNEITVEPAFRSDRDIRRNVADALATDPATDSYGITVKVSGGNVTLSGKVDSYGEKQLCVDVAKGVRGVRKVTDDIETTYQKKRPDTEIAEEIAALLRDDVRIDARQIAVNVRDGNVELSGTVPSALEKSRASVKAWVAGVHSVDNSDMNVEWFAPKSMQRKATYVSKTDEEVEKAVHDALVHDPRVWSFDVGVDSDYGVVTLTGMVDNLKASKAAEEDAHNTVGAWRIKNHLKVRPITYLSNEKIISRVKAALKRDPYLARHDILVSAYNGKVYLHGMVDSDFEKLEAEDAAFRVNGVIEVANYLDVRKDETWLSDWIIEEGVQDQLVWDTALDGTKVQVDVQDGVVTLTGTVGTWYQYMEAAKDAFRGGARELRNDIHMDHAPKS